MFKLRHEPKNLEPKHVLEPEVSIDVELDETYVPRRRRCRNSPVIVFIVVFCFLMLLWFLFIGW